MITLLLEFECIFSENLASIQDVFLRSTVISYFSHPTSRMAISHFFPCQVLINFLFYSPILYQTYRVPNGPVSSGDPKGAKYFIFDLQSQYNGTKNHGAVTLQPTSVGKYEGWQVGKCRGFLLGTRHCATPIFIIFGNWVMQNRSLIVLFFFVK